MARVFGKVSFTISVPVQSDDEAMSLLEANYRFNPEIIVAYRLQAIDCKGREHTITVHELDNIELEEFVE